MVSDKFNPQRMRDFLQSENPFVTKKRPRQIVKWSFRDSIGRETGWSCEGRRNKIRVTKLCTTHVMLCNFVAKVASFIPSKKNAILQPMAMQHYLKKPQGLQAHIAAMQLIKIREMMKYLTS